MNPVLINAVPLILWLIVAVLGNMLVIRSLRGRLVLSAVLCAIWSGLSLPAIYYVWIFMILAIVGEL